MNQIKTILVGVDFSDGSRAALQQALRVANQNRASLHIMHVIDSQALDDLAAASHEPLAAQREKALELGRRELVRWLEPFDLPENCRTEVTVGAPLDALLERAGQLNTNLIAAGAQGGNAVSPQAGSLAVRLLREAPVKVLLVDTAHTEPFRTIVCCVDFTRSAREAVDQAKRLAALGTGRVDFLHVYDPPWYQLRQVCPALSANQDLQQQYLNTLDRQLKDFVGDLDSSTARCVLHEATRHRCGIAAYAQANSADLIVLGIRRPTSPHDERADSTAERLVRELPCSVLGVKPPLESEATGREMSRT